MNNIYICEKPSQAKDLARILNLRKKKKVTTQIHKKI